MSIQLDKRLCQIMMIKSYIVPWTLTVLKHAMWRTRTKDKELISWGLISVQAHKLLEGFDGENR